MTVRSFDEEVQVKYTIGLATLVAKAASPSIIGP
jgi:hypothetical protein